MKRKLCRISVVLELVFVHFSNYRLLESWDMCWLDDGAGCYDASFCTRVNDPLDDKLSFPFFFLKKEYVDEGVLVSQEIARNRGEVVSYPTHSSFVKLENFKFSKFCNQLLYFFCREM